MSEVTPEKNIKRSIRGFLAKYQTWYFISYNPYMGVAGVPDILGCINGRFIGIEVKTSKGRTSKLQEHHIKAIISAGGIAFVARSRDDVENAFKRYNII